MSQGKKQLLEFAPLVIFFATNWKAGIFWATGVFMAVTLMVLLYTYITTRKVAKVPLASAILVGVFGGLTLYLQDETFIKVKVTLINLIFAALLLGGVVFGRYFIKDVMGEAVKLPDSASVSYTHLSLILGPTPPISETSSAATSTLGARASSMAAKASRRSSAIRADLPVRPLR